MVYTVYILQCSDGTYYVGVTNDVENRVKQHQSGYKTDSYTFSRRPLHLAYHEHFNDINQAIEFEKQVKGWRREKKEALINGEWDKLPELSKNGQADVDVDERKTKGSTVLKDDLKENGHFDKLNVTPFSNDIV